MTNVWKILAIVFIILFVLETIVVGILFSWGLKSIKDETKCANEVCFDSTSYMFDDYTNTCTCYTNGIADSQQVIE